MAGIDGLGLKLLVILIAFAMVPMISVGIVSMLEMNKASEDVQVEISNLSTTLNRSALTVAPDDADQVQLALAKARQYDEFFSRIKADNELVASLMALGSGNESCTSPPGMWIAPVGSNQTTPEKRNATIRSLCAPAKVMQGLVKSNPSLSQSYIGTEDGVLVTWPYGGNSLSDAAPFGYRDESYYAAARSAKKTLWTLHGDEKEPITITITTPIYRGEEFTGIAGMDVSLQSMYQDLSSMRGRGYPFILDESGRIVMRPQAEPQGVLKDLFESDNLAEANSSEAKELAWKMLQGKSGSLVVGLANSDGYVAFAPITSLGWCLGIVYPAEEMSLPATFIDAGIKEVAKSATQGLSDASRTTRYFGLLIFVLTGSLAIISGIFLGRRVDGQIRELSEAAEKISRGEFDVDVRSSGELATLGATFNKMARDLKDYAVRLQGDAEERGRNGSQMAFLRDVKRNLVPGVIPERNGYEISALYLPSEKNRFDLYDIIGAGDQIALAMAGIGGEGIKAAILAIMSRSLMRTMPDKAGPSEAISDLNSQINQHAQGMNLACFYAMLDPVNHTLEYVNAGFSPPFIVDPGGMVDTLGGGGLALGMLDKIDLKSERIPIQQGDVLVMYSNGLTEAVNSGKKQFGTERLINLVINNRTGSASQILDAAAKELGDFSRNHPLQADVTLLIIKRS